MSKIKIVDPDTAVKLTTEFVQKTHGMLINNSKEFQLGDPNYFKIQVAGKNATFDRDVLLLNGYQDMFKFVQHRFMDAGNLYYLDFGYVPSTDQLTKKFGIQQSNQRALGDAQIVVDLFNRKIQPIVDGISQKHAPIFRPYLSIDTETTGLKECNPYILEIGIVFEDFGFFNLKKEEKEFNVLINNGTLDPNRTQPIAMDMNAKILDLIHKKGI